MNTARTELLLELRTRLEAAPRGQRKGILSETASFLGVSAATAYRELKAIGYCQDRKRRSDAGQTCINKELAITVSGLIRKGTRANGRRALKMNTVVDILEKNGLGPLVDEETGEVSMPHPSDETEGLTPPGAPRVLGGRMPHPSTVSRAMRLYGCHPEQLATAGQNGPHQQLRTLHPNHVWEMDASVCVIFYMPRGEMAVLDERSYNERKPGNLAKLNQERVIRWLIVDHYSGCFFVRYTLGSENTKTAIEILAEAMCKRGDTDPFCGRASILYTDPGPAFTAELMGCWLKRLSIRQETHMPGAARATGSVEVHQRIVEHGFEGRLRMYKAANLADLNAHLDEWRIAYNSRKVHSRHNKTRYGMWLTIKEHELFVPQSKELLLSLAVEKEASAKVKRDLTIGFTPKGFKRQIYDLRCIPDIAIDEEVLVSVNPFDAPAVDVTVCRACADAGGLCPTRMRGDAGGEAPRWKNGARAYVVHPIVFDEAGFALSAPVIGESYKATKDTAADKALKDIQKAAYAAPTLEQANEAERRKEVPFQNINIFADVEASKPRLYMSTRGRDLTLETTAKTAATLDHVSAAIELRGRFTGMGREWTAKHMDKLRLLYPDRIPAEDLGALAMRLIDEESNERRSELRLVSGGAA